MVNLKGPDLFYDAKLVIGRSETRVVHMESSPGRVLFIRLQPGTDVIGGVKEACRANNLKAGAIVSMVGALQKCCLGFNVPTSETVIQSKYDYIRLPGPVEFAVGSGTVSETEGGEVVVHIHSVVADKHGRCYSGHLVEGENPVAANMETTVLEFKNVKMLRVHNPETDTIVINPQRI